MDPSKPLLDPVKVKACSGVEVARIKTIRATRRGLGCVVLMSTTVRHRLKAFRQVMLPEKYNAVDRSGLQIMGSEGLTILCNDPETIGDYNVYKSMVDGVITKNETSFGTLLGNWTREGWEKNAEEMEELEDAELCAIPSEESAYDETTAPPPKKKASITMETPDWARRQLKNQEQLLQKQEQQLEKQEQQLKTQEDLLKQILKAVDTGKLEQKEDASSLKEDIGAVQETLQANHIDAAFLTETLKSTTQERDGLRHTVRSQAGKTGAVTRKLNRALKENAEMKAEMKTTVERQEIIDAVYDVLCVQLLKNLKSQQGKLTRVHLIKTPDVSICADASPRS